MEAKRAPREEDRQRNTRLPTAYGCTRSSSPFLLDWSVSTFRIMSSPLPPPRKKQKTAPSDQDGEDAPLLAAAYLTTELIARVASFVPYGAGAMNVCLAVGPKHSAIIRHTCLRNNMKYMAHRLEQYVDEEVGNDQVTTYALAWMAVNTDWRKLCTADNREKFAIVSIERENEDVTFQFKTLAIFNNPSVAAEFDLVDVLKHLVEEVGIDVNAHEWNSFATPERVHLLASALHHKTCFQYLIERGDIDVFSSFFHPDGNVGGLVTDIFQVAFNYEEVELSTFQAIVCHASFDPNTPRRQDFGPIRGLFRPLQYALACIEEDFLDEDLDEMVEKFKILLAKTSADPSLRTADCLSPIDHAFENFATATDHEDRERWSRIIDAMRNKVLSRLGRTSTELGSRLHELHRNSY